MDEKKVLVVAPSERGRERERERESFSRRWYRIAGERNVVTFKLEWTTVCVAESRVGSLSSRW